MLLGLASQCLAQSWYQEVQLTPEQHVFELCGSTHTQSFLNKHTVGPPYPISLGFAFMDSTHHGSKTVFLVGGWEWWMGPLYIPSDFM